MTAKRYTGHYVYRMWIGYKLHFSREGFNILKYRAAKCAQSTYDQLKFRALFEALAEKYPARLMNSVLISNFVEEFRNSRSEFFPDNFDQIGDNFHSWVQRMKNLSHHWGLEQEEIKMIGSDDLFQMMIGVEENPFVYECLLLEEMQTGRILETANDRYGYKGAFPNYRKEVLFLQKYIPLLKQYPIPRI